MKNRDLKPRQIAFIREYLKTENGNAGFGNAYQAALAAGYKKGTAHTAGQYLLNRPGIKAELDRIRQEVLKKVIVTKEYVVEKLKKIADANIYDYVDENWRPLPKKKIPRDLAAMITHTLVENTKYGRKTELKLMDQKGALDSLGRHLGIYKDVRINTFDNADEAEAVWAERKAKLKHKRKV